MNTEPITSPADTTNITWMCENDHHGTQQRATADFIFCTREISDRENKRAQALDYIRAHCVLENGGRQFGNRWIDEIAKSMVYMALAGESWDIPFARVMRPYDFNPDGTNYSVR